MPWIAGYPREKVNWGPTIDGEKCVGCGMCLNCGKNVFRWRDGKSSVENFFNCQVVGCSTCANLCPAKAITFPDLEAVRALYKKEGIWGKVREEMIKEGKITG
ncbi:ferredoxin family protein [Aminivibrio sp.]|uniref:ATP-binding protein n=1 Tax=Aminivibrio sp. TaxID=1872489 RepID=UPI001A55AAFD|nr:ferredoxin family protein [Aminivibrio sp.]MBL3538356.1 ferredoxin family protein [Aminivibrio sp.]